MQEFKKIVKMKCGGAVKKCSGGRMKEGGSVEHDDVKEDKKLIKKAFNIHDDQLHEGKKTDLSTLKKGGRCKREGGSIRKYADGGLTSPLVQTLVNANALRQKRMGVPNVAAAPTAPMGQPQDQNIAPTPQNIGATTGPIMKKGGKVKKGCK